MAAGVNSKEEEKSSRRSRAGREGAVCRAATKRCQQLFQSLGSSSSSTPDLSLSPISPAQLQLCRRHWVLSSPALCSCLEEQETSLNVPNPRVWRSWMILPEFTTVPESSTEGFSWEHCQDQLEQECQDLGILGCQGDREPSLPPIPESCSPAWQEWETKPPDASQQLQQLLPPVGDAAFRGNLGISLCQGSCLLHEERNQGCSSSVGQEEEEEEMKESCREPWRHRAGAPGRGGWRLHHSKERDLPG